MAAAAATDPPHPGSSAVCLKREGGGEDPINFLHHQSLSHLDLGGVKITFLDFGKPQVQTDRDGCWFTLGGEDQGLPDLQTSVCMTGDCGQQHRSTSRELFPLYMSMKSVDNTAMVGGIMSGQGEECRELIQDKSCMDFLLALGVCLNTEKDPKQILMNQTEHRYESKQVSFVYLSQLEIERTCGSALLLPVHTPI